MERIPEEINTPVIFKLDKEGNPVYDVFTMQAGFNRAIEDLPEEGQPEDPGGISLIKASERVLAVLDKYKKGDCFIHSEAAEVITRFKHAVKLYAKE